MSRYYFIFFILLFFQGLSAKEAAQCHAMDGCFEDIIQQRHSGYEFDASRGIDPKHLLQLAEAARFTPSSYNEQPWRFIFCDAIQTPEAYFKVLNSLVGGNEDWASQAPLLVVVAAKANFTKNQKPNLWSKFDTGAAVMSFCYRATSLGLMTHEIGGFNITKLSQEFSIPSDYEPVVVIAVGYETPEEKLFVHEKHRLNLGDNFFMGDWNIPLVK